VRGRGNPAGGLSYPDGAVCAPAPEVARLGARPGEHLRLVREFDGARRARAGPVERRYGPAG
jgi:hypothetical protein